MRLLFCFVCIKGIGAVSKIPPHFSFHHVTTSTTLEFPPHYNLHHTDGHSIGNSSLRHARLVGDLLHGRSLTQRQSSHVQLVHYSSRCCSFLIIFSLIYSNLFYENYTFHSILFHSSTSFQPFLPSTKQTQPHHPPNLHSTPLPSRVKSSRLLSVAA